jgi:hypothetical protein
VPSVCIFCGKGSKPTNEHAIPDWLSEFVAEMGGEIVFTQWSVGSETKKWGPIRKASIHFQGLCDPCNTGWMSDLEGAVIPYFKPMMQGQPSVLSPDAQAAIAAWLYKMAMVLPYIYPGKRPPPPQDRRRQFFRTHTPGPGSHAWLAVCNAKPLRGWWSRYDRIDMHIRRRKAPAFFVLDTQDGQLLTLYSFHLAMQIFITGTDDLPLTPFVDGRFLQRIWPPAGIAINWPPPWAFDTNGMDHWHTSWKELGSRGR